MINKILQVVSISLSFIITYQYASFLDRSYYDLRRNVNGFSKGLLFISMSAVVGTTITGIVGIINLSKGIKTPNFLIVIRMFANGLAIYGLHVLREEVEKSNE